MRRIASTLALVLTGLAWLTASGSQPSAVIAALQGEVGMHLGGEVIPPRQSSAVIRNGTTFLPDSEYGLLGMFAFRDGAEVHVSEPGQRGVRARVGGVTVASETGESVGDLPAPVAVEGGRAMIPLRIAEQVGLRLGWEPRTGEVTLTRADRRTVAISRSGLVRGAGADYQAARVGTGLSAGDVVRTWEGRAELRTSRSFLRLDRHTELTVTEAPAEPGGILAAFAAFGRVWTRVVAPQPARIETPNAVASARGTAWLTEVWVDAEGRWNTRVHVGHGVVEVVERWTGRTWLLREGQSLLLTGAAFELSAPGLLGATDDFLASTLSADRALLAALSALGAGVDLLAPALRPVMGAVSATLPQGAGSIGLPEGPVPTLPAGTLDSARDPGETGGATESSGGLIDETTKATESLLGF